MLVQDLRVDLTVVLEVDGADSVVNTLSVCVDASAPYFFGVITDCAIEPGRRGPSSGETASGFQIGRSAISSRAECSAPLGSRGYLDLHKARR